MLKPANGRRHLTVTLTDFAYVDNVAITSDSTSSAEITLCRLQFYSKVVGLKLSVARTKAVHVGYESEPEPLFALYETTMEVCDIYSYLGLPTLSSKVVICHRFAAAWSAICKLRPIFHSTAPYALKIKLFKSAVKAIAAYALECVPINPLTSNILDAGHQQMICAALGINLQNSITNKEFYAKSGLLPFIQTIKKI